MQSEELDVLAPAQSKDLLAPASYNKKRQSVETVRPKGRVADCATMGRAACSLRQTKTWRVAAREKFPSTRTFRLTARGFQFKKFSQILMRCFSSTAGAAPHQS
jgi:hypothetical protein